MKDSTDALPQEIPRYEMRISSREKPGKAEKNSHKFFFSKQYFSAYRNYNRGSAQTVAHPARLAATASATISRCGPPNGRDRRTRGKRPLINPHIGNMHG
ncbi:MAG TPA: hypothetical protein VEC06_11910 [Paucimonas sp.]|nr:hypothetical protein [Paucimonas sp.]